MASILEECAPATHVEKAMMGLLEGDALHGEDVIGRWQTLAAAYPEDLAPATVDHYLQFFPLWPAAERWKVQDATIFYHQTLVEVSLNILGVLAGLNHLYYSTFQVKRLRRFVSKMRIAPERLADRLDMLFTLNPVEAGDLLERLVDETVKLVEAHMPTVDTTKGRRHIGVRHSRWVPASEPKG
jgi:hypothetical protein